jgi:hypothetical protein
VLPHLEAFERLALLGREVSHGREFFTPTSTPAKIRICRSGRRCKAVMSLKPISGFGSRRTASHPERTDCRTPGYSNNRRYEFVAVVVGQPDTGKYTPAAEGIDTW